VYKPLHFLVTSASVTSPSPSASITKLARPLCYKNTFLVY